MSDPIITVSHDESATEMRQMCSPNTVRVGMDVSGEIRYQPGQHLDALAAVERMAESLRSQIADAAESAAREAADMVEAPRQWDIPV